MSTNESENNMSKITYAHLNCYFCRGYALEAAHDATINSQVAGAQVGDNLHWARYEKGTKENA